jgi:hypothetical protein
MLLSKRTKYRFNQYEIHCEGKLKLRSHNASYCLMKVVTEAVLTVMDMCNTQCEAH